MCEKRQAEKWGGGLAGEAITIFLCREWGKTSSPASTIIKESNTLTHTSI